MKKNTGVKNYREKILAARVARDERMKANPRNWMGLTGLYHLVEGENSFGSDRQNQIVLDALQQGVCGSFVQKNKKVRLMPASGSCITVNDLPATTQVLHHDQDIDPDLIRTEHLTMMILLRGKDYYLRVWDAESPAVMEFKELKYYPVKSEYRISACFIHYDTPRPIKVLDVIGTEHASRLVGEAHFTWCGVDCTLVAEQDDDELFFNFTDKTNEDTTYPGGRFLTSAMPAGNKLILDFNQALNWPCAYTDFATCPLPPRENHLAVRIEAGEMRYRE